MKAGDLVKVKTKYNGSQIGTILKPWGKELGNAAWVVWIPNHRHSSTIASECDLEVLDESR